MGGSKKYFLLLLLTITILILLWFFLRSQNQKLLSPVLGISRNRLADNIWFPEKFTPSPLDLILAPKIDAKAAFFVETQTGQVLYQKNQNEQLPIASLTKIMTAIVTLENKNIDDPIDISERAASMEPDKMLLIAGEKLTVKELLQGIFLVSANDASEALAEEVFLNRDLFIKMMNSKAAQLGMKDTLFINPSGLDEDDRKQYSTAFDVTLMSRYAIQRWPLLINISSSPHIYIPKTENHQDYDLYSGINLLSTYPGIIGFKTGYTPQANLTLVTLARKADKEVLGVILGSGDRRDDAKALLDYSFKKLGVLEK